MAIKVNGSTCSSRVLTCLHEKQVDFEFVSVDIFSCQYKFPEFLGKNPFGQVPVLEDDDLILFASRAITAYVGEKYKEKGYDLMRQKDPKEAAMVKVWAQVESQQYNPPIAAIVYQLYVGPLQGKSPDRSIIDGNLEKLGKVLDVYEDRLGHTRYLAGDFYTVADLHHLPYTYYLMKTEAASVINERPHVKAWFLHQLSLKLLRV